MTQAQHIGSMTARGGFLNEVDICNKFNHYLEDKQAQQWLKIMGYNYQNIDEVYATHIPTRINKEKAILLGVSEERYEETIKFKKADIQITLKITIDNIHYTENLSLKKANMNAGFNQVDKRPVSTYQSIWRFNNSIAHGLKCFTGEILPTDTLQNKELSIIRDQRKKRLFMDELSTDIFKEIIAFFTQNKYLIISDIIKGRGGLSAEWLLVTRKDTENNNIDWVLKDINTTLNFYAQGEVSITPRGSLKIGRITMQRKGGTPDPTSLQFKMNPLELFNA